MGNWDSDLSYFHYINIKIARLIYLCLGREAKNYTIAVLTV